MAHDGQSTQQGQVFIAQTFCRHCRFISLDVNVIRNHVNSHTLEAAVNNHIEHPTGQAEQPRERNLLTNPIHQLIPSTAQSTRGLRGLPRSRCSQMQSSTEISEVRRAPIQTQMVQDGQQIAIQQTEETNNEPLMALIDQLDHAIPIIIDLDSDENDDPNHLDLTLKL